MVAGGRLAHSLLLSFTVIPHNYGFVFRRTALSATPLPSAPPAWLLATRVGVGRCFRVRKRCIACKFSRENSS